MRAALYARFSSENQRYESISAQLRIGKEYCASKGYNVVKIYTDEAKSGTSTAGREGFKQMILDSMDQLFDVVVFHKIDRAARNEVDYYSNMSKLERNGITVEYSGEGIDTSTVNGKLTEGIKVAVAAWYSRNLSLETKKGLRENALASKFNGGYIPFGYSVDKDGCFIADENEATAVRQIFEMKAAGQRYEDIADWLNAHGYRTRRGVKFSKASLHDILVNKKYVGTYQYGKGNKSNHRINNIDMIEIEGGMPQLVDVELFEKVGTIMHARKNGGGHAKYDYALSKKLKCECGANMTGQCCGSKNGPRYNYYVCRGHYYNHTSCKMPRIRAEQLEDTIFDFLINDLKNSKAEIIEEFVKLSNRHQDNENKKALANQIEKQELKMSRLLDLYSDSGDKLISEKYQQAKSEIEILKKEYSLIVADKGVDTSQVEAFLDEMTSRSFSREEYRKVFDLFVEHIVIHEDKADVQLTIRHIQSVVALTRYYPLYNCFYIKRKQRCSGCSAVSPMNLMKKKEKIKKTGEKYGVNL